MSTAPPLVAITGVDKLTLLLVLYLKAGIPSDCDEQQFGWNTAAAQEALPHYIETFGGRAIYANLSGDYACPAGYDSMAGQGTFEACVEEARSLTFDLEAWGGGYD
ncbi:uncharacterized protein BP01DRAFT_379975 [Aspergillus saccharolyticus JOP 1030-1]|uniref:Uncharacterized protein n=1 Tax=Aspergillus saccharolyticus JOP 1030-1 TaxID=1450539 RepID=A0A318ZMZ9_9EURO|nr:hypothetical protein BP01DRAFT_379975 [Aspergillus saccharolyticus JOP 1030-1]PYH48055.1 hypothetical protein BP01DRAFT_379975 [Aspergillus saccharolyticus JOP 1030-1]